MSAGTSDNGVVLPLDDPIADQLRSAAQSAGNAAALVTSFLGLRDVFPEDLAEDVTFQMLLTEALVSLERFGTTAVVASLGD